MRGENDIRNTIYPAHAGINLGARLGYARNHDLPRTRGDKPLSEYDIAYTKESTPHTRG